VNIPVIDMYRHTADIDNSDIYITNSVCVRIHVIYISKPKNILIYASKILEYVTTNNLGEYFGIHFIWR
jgi:hypothetical protein